MFKVFLVEDEFVVREGIKNNIDWTREGFLFSGEATDGELAYKQIKSIQPDIIITDIKMPFMDGLELSRLVMNEFPHIKIIILSGHEEFTYAQEAIKVGVTEYLLKPISSIELLKVIKRVAKMIETEREKKEIIKRYRQEIEENEIFLKRKLFDDMVKGSLSTIKILEQGKKLGFDMSAQYYQIILFKYSIKGSNDEGYSNKLLGLANLLNESKSRYKNILTFDRGIEGNAYIMKADSLEELDITCNTFLNNIKDILSKYPEVSYFGGIGIPVNRLSRLSESYESASLYFARRFFLKENAILSSNQTPDNLYKENHTSIENVNLEDLDTKKVESFLKNGEASEIHFFVDEFIKSVIVMGRKSLLFKQYFLINTYFTVLSFLKDLGREDVMAEEEAVNIHKLNIMMNSQEVRDYLVRILSIAIEQRDIIRTKRYHSIIEQSKDYIGKHYNDDNLSLNEVAAYVNLSPSHFSTVFSRETGTSFIRYLTDLRMAKARELLKCTDLRCLEISNEVGYKDPHYFSYLFKKEHNCTPMQYRNLDKSSE